MVPDLEKTSDKVLERLMKLHPKVIDLSLERLQSLLDKLGNPERKLPPVIHVAGTNGKGSTVATLRAMAEAAGHRVHVYTSPHLVKFNERIRIAGRLIDEDDLITLLEECERENGPDPITFFEVTTAAALLAFSRTPADLCILEVGLGGRLDATNVIGTPAATVITPVSLDHQQFLGETLGEIAAEKAGILKEGSPAIIGPQQKDGEQAIADKLKSLKMRGLRFGKEWFVEIAEDGTHILYEDAKGPLSLPLPTLLGDHQIMNAGMAIAAIRTQKAVKIPDAAIKAGLGWVRWPARLQDISSSSLAVHLPDNSDLWLDGGHNPAAATAIAKFLKETDIDRPITLILGMMGTKDVEGYLKPLIGLVSQVITVAIPGEDGAAAPAYLAAAATDAGIKGTITKDVTSALQMIADQTSADKPPFVLIGGSLYLAGDVLRTVGIQPR